MPIYKEVAQQPGVHYEAGGSTLNTLRMTQWLLQTPYACTFIGCVADDEPARRLKANCEKVKLRTMLQTTNSGVETGRCAVLVREVSRSMVTYLGAAKHLSLDFVKTQDVWRYVQEAQFCYISGYVVNTCYEAILEIGRFMAARSDTLFCFNLSAPFLPKFFSKEIDAILPYVDILFMNEDEAMAYAEKHEQNGQTLPELTKRLAASPRNGCADKKRIIVITRGASPVLVYDSKDGRVRQFEVPQLAPESIIDTNGAGDAFTAGFMADYIQTMSVDSAVKSALKAAAYIIGRSGFSLGNHEDY